MVTWNFPMSGLTHTTENITYPKLWRVRIGTNKKPTHILDSIVKFSILVILFGVVRGGAPVRHTATIIEDSAVRSELRIIVNLLIKIKLSHDQTQT